MKSSVRFAAAAAVLFLGLLGSLPAQAADYPQVKDITPFTAECNYMSNAGYLRYLVFARDGIWLSRAESVAIVQNQGMGTGE